MSNFMGMNTTNSISGSESVNPHDRINHSHSSPNKGPQSQGGASIQGSAASGSRGTMNQTQNGKNFPYQMHRRQGSNKLPHIASNNSKDGQSIQQPNNAGQNIYSANNTQ